VEAFLIDEWLGADESIPVIDDASLSVLRERTREAAAAQAMSAIDAGRLASIVSELARNQLRHARRGQIAVRPIARGALRGVEITAADEGEGLADPARALEGTPRTDGSLGVGVASVCELAHEVDFDVRLREGTCIRARLFAGEAPRRRQVGIFGRPYRDEPRSGDHACVHRAAERLVVGVCDGLGHGGPARTAAGAAMRVFAQQRAATPQVIVEECHRTLGPTRGAVMAVVALREPGPAALDLASVGNITVELARPRASRRFGATSFVVGSPQRGWRAHVEATTVERDEVLIAFTDGITSRASVNEDLALLREHPIVIAQRLVERFGREDDDVLVLVAK
jgi:anti-sigma regulatory factor (Ser/Thr protein kinase)